MNDWKIIWNGFCDEVATSVNKNNSEKIFEEDIAREFFRALDWYRLNKGLIEQYPIKFATATHRADFALFVSGKEAPEIIVELKRPKKKKEEKDATQLIDYMRQESCSYGVLLLGTRLEIYYIDYSTPKHEATLVETIKYQHDNDAAHQFMEVLYRGDYTPAKLLEYCHKRVKINKTVEYWCSQDGKTEILDMIIERSKLPEHLQETLRSTLLIEVKRIDGLNPVSAQVVSKTDTVIPDTPNTSATPQPRRKPKVWMIPASPKFFAHKDCFDELGYIYWKQYNKFQVGDTGYIYYSQPTKCVLFKFEVAACDIPYNKAIDAEKKFYKNQNDFEEAKSHNRFYLIKRIGEHTKGKLTLSNMLQNGLKWAPQGALNLSDDSFKELLKYIEENF